MVVLEWLFWGSLALIFYAHIGYPVLLMLLDRAFGEAPPSARDRSSADLPSVTLVIAAYDEEEVIERKVENALALDYPPEKLWVIGGLRRVDGPHRRARPGGRCALGPRPSPRRQGARR